MSVKNQDFERQLEHDVRIPKTYNKQFKLRRATTAATYLAVLLLGIIVGQNLPSINAHLHSLSKHLAPSPSRASHPSSPVGSHNDDDPICVQPAPVSPPASDALDASRAHLASPSGKLASARLLSQAVQYDTSSYDDLGPVTGPSADPYWNLTFPPFHKFLETSFPVIWEKAEVTVVHEHALLVVVEGKRWERKPAVFMAHMDVVPVEPATAGEWTWPPFGGNIKDGYVWGRGCLFCSTRLYI